MKKASGSKMSQWCRDEFCDIDLGDARLNQRLIQTAERLASLPQAPINQACKRWAAAKGAYRLFANDKCDREVILKTHVQKTRERIKEYEQIFVIQDTTVLDFRCRDGTEGLGLIANKNKPKQKGLIAHTALAVGSDGVSLGLIGQSIWARDNPEFAHIWEGQKESSKWLRILNKTHALVPKSVRAITVADREADITSFLEEACKLESPFIIRARDRKLAERDSLHESAWLSDHLGRQPVAFDYTIDVPVKASKNAKVSGWREATIKVHYGAVSIRANHERKREFKYLQHKISKAEMPPETGLPLFAVMAVEKTQDVKIEPVRWMLLTNLPVETAEQAIECIRGYKMRWHIENFHRVLKSGCTVEECRLQSAEKLDRYITLMSVIAWRLYWMTHLSRAQPERSAESILKETEWKLLHKYHYPDAPPLNRPPTIRQVIHWIAMLGGFLGRKGDGDPGVITLWRGYQRFQDLLIAWELAHPRMKRAATCG